MPRPSRLRRRGTTLVEMSVAGTIIVAALAVAFPTMNSIGRSGQSGRAQSWTQADNRQALIRISRELMNGSMTATDTLGNARMEVLSGTTRTMISGHDHDEDDQREGGHGTPTSTTSTIGSASNYYKSTTAGASGSGTRGRTVIGRARSDAMGSANTYDAGAARPREKVFNTNSRLRFQKILSYAWGADGEPIINWGGWVEYAVQGRNLVRIEGTQTQIVSPNCSGFLVEPTSGRTLLLTIVSEHRSADGKEVSRVANSIEVVPKN